MWQNNFFGSAQINVNHAVGRLSTSIFVRSALIKSKRGCETWVEFEMGNSPAAPELMDTAIVAEGAPPDPVPKSYRIPERPDDMCTPDDHELIAHLQQKKRSFEAAFLKPH